MPTNYMKIDEFYANSLINGDKFPNGLLRLNRFIGILDITKTPKTGFDQDFLTWQIFKATCPALAFDVEHREVDMIPRYYVKNYRYDDLSVSYLESSNLTIKNFFFQWMNSILNAQSYVRQYYNDISSASFKLYPLNKDGNITRYDIFRDLIPVSVDSIEFDVEGDDGGAALTTIKFKYISHSIEANAS